MAQQVAAKTSAKNPPASPALGKEEEQIATAIANGLKEYTPKAAAEVARDALGNYDIQLNMRLPDFDTKSARAYKAVDRIFPKKELFALVCEPDCLIRQHLVDALLGVEHSYRITLRAADIVPLSQPAENRYVLIYDRPDGQKLSALLDKTNSPLSHNFICSHIIAPIASAIHDLSELHITHGYIHPDNIFYKNVPVLGDCITEPCGFSQTFYFEPLSRMQSVPAGKGEGSSKVDYYALAVLVLYILCRKDHFTPMTPESLARSMFKIGEYNALTRNKDLPEFFYDFFRGLLSQNGSERWGDKHLQTWLKGKRYNVMLPPPPPEALRPLMIGEEAVNSRRELAHILYQRWDDIPDILSEGKMAQWITISLRNKELLEQVNHINKAIHDSGARNEQQIDEQLHYLITAFDHDGPLRMKQLAFHIDGIGPLFATLYKDKSDKKIEQILHFIEQNMYSFWYSLHRKEEENTLPKSVNNAISAIDKLRVSVRYNSLGFGQERILYDLNPSLACQSPLLGSSTITTLPALLTKLDQIASRLGNGQDPMDKHIAAFIASKTNVQHEIRIHDLEANPTLAKHPSIIALKLLASAQNRCGVQKFPGLSHWIALRVLPLLSDIKSQSLRQRVKSSLLGKAQTGKCQEVANLIIGSGFAPMDANGYIRAKSLYHNNARHIVSYRTQEHINYHSAIVARVISQTIAYFAVLIVLWGIVSHGG